MDVSGLVGSSSPGSRRACCSWSHRRSIRIGPNRLARNESRWPSCSRRLRRHGIPAAGEEGSAWQHRSGQPQDCHGCGTGGRTTGAPGLGQAGTPSHSGKRHDGDAGPVVLRLVRFGHLARTVDGVPISASSRSTGCMPVVLVLTVVLGLRHRRVSYVPVESRCKCCAAALGISPQQSRRVLRRRLIVRSGLARASCSMTSSRPTRRALPASSRSSVW